MPVDTPRFASIVRGEAKASAVYALSIAVHKGGVILLAPVFWQKLTPADFGVIAVTEILQTFLVILLGLSLDQAITRFYYEWDEDKRDRYVGTVCLLSWCSTAILGGASFLFFRYTSLLLFPEVDFNPYITLGLANAILLALINPVFMVIRIRQLPKLFAVYSLSAFALQTVLSIYMVLILDRGVFGYLLALVLSNCVVVVACVGIMTKIARIAWEPAALRDVFKFSLPLVPFSIMQNLTAITDRFMLQQFGSLRMVGIYSLSLKFASGVTIVHNALKMSYGPFLYKTINRARGVEIVSGLIPLYILPIFFAGLFVSLLTADLVRLINQPAYFAVAAFVPYLAVGQIVAALYVYYAPGISLSKKTHLLLIPGIFQFVTIALASYVLVANYGVYGVVAAKLGSVAVFFALTVAISKKVYERWRHRWSALAVASGWFMIAMLASKLFRADSLWLSSAIHLAVVVAYAAICFQSWRVGTYNRLKRVW